MHTTFGECSRWGSLKQTLREGGWDVRGLLRTKSRARKGKEPGLGLNPSGCGGVPQNRGCLSCIPKVFSEW